MSPGEVRRAGRRIDPHAYYYAMLRQIIGYLATGALITLAYCLMSRIISDRCPTHFWIPLAAIFVIFKLDGWVVRRLWARRESRSPAFGPHVMSILPDGLVDETPTARHFYKWSGIERIDVDKDFIYVIVDSPLFYLVSKCSFEEETQAEEFFSTMMRNHQAARSPIT
jgi:hypothetical protein